MVTDIDGLVADLSRAEKLALVCGTNDPDGTATGYLPGVPRLDVPPFRLVDGPLGIRAEGERATAFPATLATAATFDPDLAREQGAAMGREARAHDQHSLLAPGVNIVRVPHCGRNFEYLSEDPVLASAFSRALVDGIESENVVATVKHFVANNQETHRTTVSADVDERTLRELYLPPFRAAVEAGVGSVMTAYNRVNGTHMSDHAHLVGDVLKDEWGFSGYVVSDWYGLETTVGAANAGLDLEMPGVPSGPDDEDEEFEWPDGIPDGSHAGLFGEPLAAAIDDGSVPADRLDDMVRRVLGQMARIGLFADSRPDGELDSQRHRDLARDISTRGTVLLDNDGVLPLADDTDVALIGPHIHEAKLGGGGSSETTPFHSVSPVDGLTERAGGTVATARGIPEIESVSLFDLLPFVDSGHENDASSAPDGDPSLDDAVAAAEAADVAVVLARDATTEARDRDSLALPGQQDELVEAVAAANDRTVVVLRSGGPVETPWRDDVAAVVEQWYPGQADGAALASVLYGDSDPGGRLPVTFAPEGSYLTSDERRFPGEDDVARYDEGVFVGYRHFDSGDDEPTYPFGHGHSYATFEYGDATVVGDATVELSVRNVADRPGRDVVQAYVRPPAVDGIDRPVREFAAAQSVALDPGETGTVTLELDELAFSRYDEGWTVDSGQYRVEVGRSSSDVRATVDLDR
ncbi:glycoside hydrolase family 3 C-terminal domain-containing protein [Haloarcula sp. S1CR25-12]|uniref:Glycoside hydrolase family 3 C-terminal domain-containing protein n=1 Tax=Haloarcula saliterrae TaxID=2950534 RepID=A0ABU2FAL3_9EURY|nr:glycoside hydrolase family 3 C-terminal domain-containing protein [Haloarcula sp. S1CR25-12]MDS0259318.1 glycoside hydrolase family 3 C-terminal domain-containing protein [Haloarcula sp. S1CR25-12]